MIREWKGVEFLRAWEQPGKLFVRLLVRWRRCPAGNVPCVFWLLGPFILLIERSPADLWLSVIALAFVGRSIARRDGWWLRVSSGCDWLFFSGVRACCQRPCPPCRPIRLARRLSGSAFHCLPWLLPFGSAKTSRLSMPCCCLSALGMMIICVILLAEIVHRRRPEWWQVVLALW